MVRETARTEILDGPMTPADRTAELVDIDRLNTWFGGYAITFRELRRLIRDIPRSRSLVIVDVGGGTATLACRLVQAIARGGRPVRVIVVDRDPHVLKLGLGAADGNVSVTFVQAEATALPFRPRSADVLTASLLFHHLDPDAAIAALVEMRTTARVGVVVNDLLRSRCSLALVWLATRLLAQTEMARYDGPLSVRRAYSAVELGKLATRAGLSPLSIRRYGPLARLTAVSAFPYDGGPPAGDVGRPSR